MSAGQFCSQCGAQIVTGASFCAKCGATVQGAAASAPPFQPQYVQPTKKRGPVRKVGIAIVVLLFACMVFGAMRGGGSSSASGTTSQPAQATVWPIKQAVATKDWTLQVADVKRAGQTLKWSEYGNTVSAAGTFLVVKVDMKNTGAANFGVNTWDFELRDSAGVTYKHADQLGASGYSEYAGGKRVGDQVPPGVTVAYYLIYDINPSASGLQLVFKQGGNPVFGLGQ